MSVLVYKILYGGAYRHCFTCDCVLDIFHNFNHINNEQLYENATPPDLESVLDFLASEGMIKTSEYGISITEKGKAKRDSGGYKRQILKERIIYLGVIAGIIVALTTIIAFFRSRYV